MIKVLIVEDSPVMQELLFYTISKDPEFQIVGLAENGEEAIELSAKLNPDIIAMDWYMPKMDGLQATRRIMERNPKPIVIVTASLSTKNVMFSFGILEAGALAIVKKPPSVAHPDYKSIAKELTQTLKLMSEVKLVKRISRISNIPEQIKPPINKINKTGSDLQIVVIGASTGGPLAIQKILSGLPNDFSVPLLIVQHISNGFVGGFVEWLNKTTNFQVHMASQGEYPLPGHCYVAPDGFHMGVENGPKIVLSNHGLENGLRPSVAYLFRTAAKVFGSKSIGVLLTGMGRDGADELKLMSDYGAVTIAQDKESSVVHGMPGEAIKLNAADYILPPDGIIATLINLSKKNISETSL